MEQNSSFPQILYDIVSDPSVDDIISWLPHGRGFLIHDKSRFANEILTGCGALYTSFTRRLKRWCFTRVPGGAEMGAYYHPSFIQGDPSRVMEMEYPGRKAFPAPLESIHKSLAIDVTDDHETAPLDSTHHSENLLEQPPSTDEDYDLVISPNEAVFRRKAWLALAPLYGGTSLMPTILDDASDNNVNWQGMNVSNDSNEADEDADRVDKDGGFTVERRADGDDYWKENSAKPAAKCSRDFNKEKSIDNQERESSNNNDYDESLPEWYDRTKREREEVAGAQSNGLCHSVSARQRTARGLDIGIFEQYNTDYKNPSSSSIGKSQGLVAANGLTEVQTKHSLKRDSIKILDERYNYGADIDIASVALQFPTALLKNPFCNNTAAVAFGNSNDHNSIGSTKVGNSFTNTMVSKENIDHPSSTLLSRVHYDNNPTTLLFNPSLNNNDIASPATSSLTHTMNQSNVNSPSDRDTSLASHCSMGKYQEGQGAAKRRRKIVECDVLKKWYDEHKSKPYPTKEEKAELALTIGLTKMQVRHWFEHTRARRKKAAGVAPARGGRLSEEAVGKLKKWYEEHESHPYPTKEEKTELALTTGLTDRQVQYWFENERKRRNKAVPVERLSKEAVEKLKKWYNEHGSRPYPTNKEYAEFALTTGLTDKQVQHWFQRERTKRKKAADVTPAPGGGLSEEAADKLKNWYDEHKSHPYPTKEEKAELALTAVLTEKQVRHWFEHTRARKKRAAGITPARGGRLCEEAVDKLMKWYEEHESHPYPTNEEKTELALTTGLIGNQVQYWFESERVRRNKAATVERLSKEAVDKLNKWYDEHGSRPYPTNKEYVELALTTGLTDKQVQHWFQRERTRRKKAAGVTPAPVPVGGISKEAVDHLKTRYEEHELHRYPPNEEKKELALTTELTEKQVQYWFEHERAKRERAASVANAPVERLCKECSLSRIC